MASHESRYKLQSLKMSQPSIIQDTSLLFHCPLDRLLLPECTLLFIFKYVCMLNKDVIFQPSGGGRTANR